MFSDFEDFQDYNDVVCDGRCEGCKLRYDCDDSDINSLQRSNDRNRD